MYTFTLALKEKHLGKVLLVKMPTIALPRYRWITRRNDEGRFYGRAPKIGVRIHNLPLKRENDFGPERILPKGTKVDYVLQPHRKR
jgi:hypothetical protein